jgi:hypothetical protein
VALEAAGFRGFVIVERIDGSPLSEADRERLATILAGLPVKAVPEASSTNAKIRDVSGKAPTNKVKTWFTLREYAYLSGETYRAVVKQRQRGTLPVPASRKGKQWVIYFAALVGGAPELWASIVTKFQLENRGKS